jgi:molybdopterin molybdotransferase
MSALLSVSEAKHNLLLIFKPLASENVPISRAVGRVLSEPIQARFDIPPFDNSGMDGFAVRAADISPARSDHEVELTVVGDIPAGQATHVAVDVGQTARIMTGAVLPPGADAVVPVEETDFNARQPGIAAPEKVKILRSVKPGENVRPKGQDVRAGEVVMQAGNRLRPQDIGFLAMLGMALVPVHRLPRVAVFATGDELVPVGADLGPGKIYDSNTYTLISQIEKYGAQAVNLGIVADNIDAVRYCLDRAKSQNVDLIVSSAGVSVGAFDFVRHVVEQGGRLDFWRVNMRPGKPLAFGEYKGIPFIGLPGNPVSAFVGFEVFVRPAILKMSGVVGEQRPFQKVELLDEIESDGRESYLRAVVTHQDGIWKARLTGHQGSGNLRSLVQANALLLVPSGVKSLPVGAELDAWILDVP